MPYNFDLQWQASLRIHQELPVMQDQFLVKTEQKLGLQTVEHVQEVHDKHQVQECTVDN